MKRIFVLLVLFAIYQVSSADLLNDIINGKYYARGISIPRSMNDGENYTLLVGNAVVKYNYRTGNVVDTIFSISRLKKNSVKYISGYIFSPNELKLLVYNNVKYRYRRSYTADYFVYDIKRNELTPLSENGSQEVPLFSPDSRYVAFARQNNLYLKKLDFNTESAITTDGKFGSIINGIADWVYEEEFEQVRYFEWSPDSKMLAFVRFDETKVPEYSIPIYKNEENEDLRLYPGTMTFKYPKAGESNSIVSVCVYDDYYKNIKTMNIGKTDDEFYIPRLKWTNNNDKLAICKMNRIQNKLEIYFANPKSTLSTLILQLTDKYYVDFTDLNHLFFLQNDKGFVAVNEKDGYRHAYLYDFNGVQQKQLTKGNWDITEVYGYDEKKQILYYQSAEVSPLQRDVYTVDIKGKKTRLTDGKGTHNANFNNTYTYFIDNTSDLNTPPSISLKTNTGATIKVLEDNKKLKTDVQALELPKREIFKFKTSENIELNGWILKPANFDASKKYPILLVQYSGPNSQQALDSWGFGWENYLSSKGYMIACVDGRGTGARGAEFRKCTYMKIGVLESTDQIETAKYFGTLPYIDNNRIGIWGWSYGGFMTLMSMTSGEKVFKAGIAVAPVTDYRLYDSTYTERYMRTPQENFKGYDLSSAQMRANKLEGNLLIIHGSADDNVHEQNTMQYIDKLVSANKQFEMQIYTDKNHSILGRQTRLHLYTRMSEFLFRNL